MGGSIQLIHKLMTSSLFFEWTAAIKLLALEITDLLNLCQDNATQVAIAPWPVIMEEKSGILRTTR